MRCYVIEVCAIPEGTCAIQGYGPKSGITDMVSFINEKLTQARNTLKAKVI